MLNFWNDTFRTTNILHSSYSRVWFFISFSVMCIITLDCLNIHIITSWSTQKLHRWITEETNWRFKLPQGLKKFDLNSHIKILSSFTFCLIRLTNVTNAKECSRISTWKKKIDDRRKNCKSVAWKEFQDEEKRIFIFLLAYSIYNELFQIGQVWGRNMFEKKSLIIIMVR